MNTLKFVYEIARVLNVWLIFYIVGLIQKPKSEETSSLGVQQFETTGLTGATRYILGSKFSQCP